MIMMMIMHMLIMMIRVASMMMMVKANDNHDMMIMWRWGFHCKHHPTAGSLGLEAIILNVRRHIIIF